MINRELDREKVLISNPKIDGELLRKSIELQEQLKRNGYRKPGYRILDRDNAIFDEQDNWVGGKSPFELY